MFTKREIRNGLVTALVIEIVMYGPFLLYYFYG